jgi:hypothetical protein
VLAAGPVQPGDVVGCYLAALAAGDAAAAAGAFTPDGYLRTPTGRRYGRDGRDGGDGGDGRDGGDGLRSFFDHWFGGDGGIELQPCAVTDDGVRCAVEYNCVRWGIHDLPPQAGLGVYERGPDGLLAAARVYDDVEVPAEYSGYSQSGS